MDEHQASRLIAIAGGITNVTMRDCFPLVTNTDLRLDRVNIEVRNGKVTRAHVG